MARRLVSTVAAPSRTSQVGRKLGVGGGALHVLQQLLELP